jgi:hypothetical protein
VARLSALFNRAEQSGKIVSGFNGLSGRWETVETVLDSAFLPPSPG